MLNQHKNNDKIRENVIKNLTKISWDLGNEHIIGMNEDELLLEINRMENFTEVAIDAYNWLSELYPKSAKIEGIRIVREEFGHDTALQEYVLFILYSDYTSDAIDLIVEKADTFTLGVLRVALSELSCKNDPASELPTYLLAVEKIKQRISRLTDKEREFLGQDLEDFEKMHCPIHTVDTRTFS